MSDNGWLATLSSGDKVILHYSGYSNTRGVKTIERCTATQVLLKRNGSEWRFSKKDGWEVGARGYNSARITAYDAAVVAEIRLEDLHRKVLSALKDVHRSAVDVLDAAQCEEVLDMLASLSLYAKETVVGV